MSADQRRARFRELHERGQLFPMPNNPGTGAGGLANGYAALVRAGGNKKAAAKMLGLSRRALYRRLERLDLAATITRRRESVVIGDDSENPGGVGAGA